MTTDKRDGFLRFTLKQPDKSGHIVQAMMDTMQVEKTEHPHDVLELSILYELAYGLHDSTGVEGFVVNCGMYRGTSMCVMAEAVRTANQINPVIGIDPYYDIPDDGIYYAEMYAALRRNIEVFNLGNYTCPIIYDDVGFFELFNLQARVIFVDTNHLYKHTKNEIDMLSPLLCRGGWFVIHDYWDEEPGVMRAVNEFLDTQTMYNLTSYCMRYSDGNYGKMVLMEVIRK